jgi:site-specific recombinase XerD
MTNSQLTIYHGAGLETISSEAADYIRASKSAATKRAYASDIKDFERWASDQGQPGIPTTADAICDYIAALARAGAKVATIERRLASLSRAHKFLEHANPARSERVKLELSGIKRVHGEPPAQKAALTIEDLRAVCYLMTDSLKDKRDRAIVTMLFAGAMRRSELASLTRADVRVLPKELIITLRRTKTDQVGAGTTKRMPRLADETICPHRAFTAWIEAAAISSGPVFRRVSQFGAGKNPLCDKSIAQVVQQRARQAGLEGNYGGHSGRSGFVTSAFDAGVSEADIMSVTDHKSVTMVRRYRRRTGAEQAKAVLAVMGG